MKKKEVTWVDFGENDKITEELLGLRRDSINKQKIRLFIKILAFFVALPYLIFIVEMLFTLDIDVAKFISFVFKTIIIAGIAFLVDKLISEKSSNNFEKIKSTIQPVKGKIVKIVKYKYYMDGTYRHCVYTVFAEYFNEKLNRPHVVKTSSFSKDISMYLGGDKVDIYLKPNGKFEVSGFEFRNRDNPEKADIPIEVREIYETSSSIG